MLLYMLRHGQSHANVRHVVTGTPDDPLTELGKEQALSAKNFLETISFHSCYASPWKRAAQTAAIVYPQGNFVIDARIGEANGGNVADMPLETFYQEYPDFYGKFDPAAPFPGGESHLELNARVIEWLKETASTHKPDDLVLAATHTGPISCMLQYALGVPMSEYPRFKLVNAGLTVLRIPPGAEQKEIELVGYNVAGIGLR